MSGGFDLPLLQTISDWQRSSTPSRALALKAACASLPEKFRTCGLCCFRQIALPKGGVWSLIGEDKLPEKISAWTASIEVAKTFKGGVPPEGQGYQGVILCVRPPAGSVIVNIGELYREPAFIEALEQHKESIVGYGDGAGRYRDRQSEVVLEIAAVTPEDIYSMGGHSSPFEYLVDIAAEEIYGPNATPAQRKALLLSAEHVRSEAGPSWLDVPATQRVLARLKPQVEPLREIKRQQDSR